MQSEDTHRIRTAGGRRGGTRSRHLARRRRVRRRRAVLAGAVAAAAAAVLLHLSTPWQDDGAAVAASRETAGASPAPAAPPPSSGPPEATGSPTASVSPEASGSSAATTEEDGPREEERVDPDSVPASGSGSFAVARANASPRGGGSPYRVEVEKGIGVDPDAAAEEIARILADPRGWSKGGSRSFRQVDDASAGLVIRIGTPTTTDSLCGRYGLDTHGEVNCRGGENVMVNLRRWLLGSPTFDGPVSDYRALIINHEVGHWLGHGHETCPGAGRPAPVMMQQIKGLKGCESNAWPYDRAQRYLGGPSVP
ncbi:DUF3152 domain-containing protein [Streptomyces sp. NPDC048590]|uniref:DUF3152 domain-containing protein n=1 Tax=Streptomyces sp. NPDC048590 TaxID=3365574 RepID=UPI003715E430